MDFSFSKEQQLIKDNIVAFARKELNKDAIMRDREQEFSKELWLRSVDQKLQGLPVESEYGGAGLDPVSTIIALEALGYGCTDGGLNFSVCAHLLACVIPIWKYGTEAQKKQYLPGLCDGTQIAANAMTESGSGSDAFAIKTKAEKTATGYVLNGIKTFTSNGPVADIILVYAVTDATKGYFGGISAFIIDKNMPGVTIGETFEKMGLRSCKMCEFIFENVTVPESAVLGAIGAGAGIFNYSMEWERTGIAACHVGTMDRLLELSVNYAQTRVIGNEHIGKKQAIAHTIAGMKTQLEAARMLTYKAAAGIDTSRDNAINASVAKLFVSEAFRTIAMETLQIHGGNGYMTSYEIERTLRDAIGSTLYSGTSEIQKNIIAGWLGL